MDQPETHVDIIETDNSEWSESNTKPGFLCFPITEDYKGEGCACKVQGQCPNVHCIIKGHLQNRPNTKMTEESGMTGMIIVPILKRYEKQNQNTFAGTNDIVDEVESIPEQTENAELGCLYKEIEEMIQEKLFKMTKLRKPSSIEELAMFLKATESDEFKEMLGDKFDELANSENGAEKIKLITKHFENRGEGPRTLTDLKDQN